MKLRVRLVKSVIGRKPNQRKTVKALGLNRINKVIEVESNPAVKGMIRTIEHLVEIEELS